MAWKIDETDRRILQILRENARLPNEKLGRKVGLSEPAARRRVANLQTRGVIRRFTVDVEEGGAVQAIVSIAAEPHLPSSRLVKEIEKKEGIGTIWEISGESDLIVSLHAPDMDSLNRRVDEIRNLEGVKMTKTNMIMKKWR